MRFVLFVLIAVSCRAGCPELRELISKTYDFSPSKLTDTLRKRKTAEMDSVWRMVDKDKATLAPCLQAELEKANPASWFFFDGSSLLMHVASSDAARRLQLRALENVPIEDVALREWTEQVADFGATGLDTRKAAERWFQIPEAGYSVPQHAFTVNAFTGAMILYGSMREDLATPELIRIAKATKHPGRSNAVRLLLDQATPEAWAALKSLDIAFLPPQGQQMVKSILAQRPTYKPRAKPKTTREQFLTTFRAVVQGNFEPFAKLMVEIPDGELDAVAVLKSEDIPLIRQTRRRLMANSNPHLLETCRYLTVILYTLVR